MPNNKKILAIELTNKCNLSCAHCPTGKTNISQGFMDEMVFRECLNYCEGYTELNWRGETLLHPDILKFTEIAKKFKPTLNLGFHTNGLFLDEDKFFELTQRGLDWIHVSLHSPESCRKYFDIISWNSKIENPLKVYAEVDNTQEELIALSNGFSEGMYRSDHISNWGGFLTKYRKVNINPAGHALKCSFVRDNYFVAAYDGTVNACCWDFELRHSLGHISDFGRIEHKPSYELCSSCIWIEKSPQENLLSTPMLIEEGYKGYNIVFLNRKWYAVKQTVGPLDLASIPKEKLDELILKKECFITDSLKNVFSRIDTLI